MPVGNEKFLSDMREGVKAAMEAEPYYGDLPILNERLQDIDAKIDETVEMAGGICIVLSTPKVGGVITNVLGANFKDIKFAARIFENLNLNETGKACLDVAIYTAAFWSQLKPDTLSATLKPDSDTITLGSDPRGLNYDVNFSTEGGTKIQIPRLEDLTIDAGDLDAIALAHPAPGAGIFYTTNDTYPAPRNPASQLFLAPFSAPSGTTIRARAWLPGYLPSAELKQIL